MAAVWDAYEEASAAATPHRHKDRLLAYCLIQEFGSRPKWFGSSFQENHRDPDRDPCVPAMGTEEYNAIYFVVLKAAEIVGNTEPWDPRLNDYLPAFNADGSMNRHWLSPLDVIDRYDDLRPGFITKLKAATLGSQTGP